MFKKYLNDNNVTMETFLNLPVKDSEQLRLNSLESEGQKQESFFM